MAKQCIGLDIGSSSIKLTQMSLTKTGAQLASFGVQPLPPQSIVEGTIMDHSAVADAIRSLWKQLKLKNKEVAIALAGHSVIIKKIAVPSMSPDELETNIRTEAEHHIPFGKDEVEIDFHVTNPQNANGQTELLLVAAKREVVADYVQVVREAQLIPSVVDVAAFASQNAYELNYTPDGRETVVLVTVGAATSNINVVRGQTSLFTRDITVGGNNLSEEIQKRLGITVDEAEAYKIGGGEGATGVVPQEAVRAMEAAAESMAGEFQRSIDFFLATTPDASLTRILVGGGSAKAAPLLRALEKRSRLNVEPIDVWRRIELPAGADRSFTDLHSCDAIVSVGLAMRAGGDR